MVICHRIVKIKTTGYQIYDVHVVVVEIIYFQQYTGI